MNLNPTRLITELILRDWLKRNHYNVHAELKVSKLSYLEPSTQTHQSRYFLRVD